MMTWRQWAAALVVSVAYGLLVNGLLWLYHWQSVWAAIAVIVLALPVGTAAYYLWIRNLR